MKKVKRGVYSQDFVVDKFQHYIDTQCRGRNTVAAEKLSITPVYVGQILAKKRLPTKGIYKMLLGETCENEKEITHRYRVS